MKGLALLYHSEITRTKSLLAPMTEVMPDAKRGPAPRRPYTISTRGKAELESH